MTPVVTFDFSLSVFVHTYALMPAMIKPTATPAASVPTSEKKEFQAVATRRAYLLFFCFVFMLYPKDRWHNNEEQIHT